MHKALLCLSTFFVASILGLAIALIIVPVDDRNDEPKEIGVFNTSGLEYLGHNIYRQQLENDTHVTLFIVTTLENETIESSIETPCCDFLGDKGHWKTRDMPLRVHQSSQLKTLIGVIGNLWYQATQIDLIGTLLESNLALTEQRRLDAWANNMNVLGYQSLPDNPDALAITYLSFQDTSLRHIINYGVAINADIGNICDASHNSNCYDLQTILNHEFGHVYGLADLYLSSCATRLMFNSLEPGEIRKRSIDFTTKSCANELYEGVPLEGEEVEEVEEEEGTTSFSSPNNVPKNVVSIWLMSLLLLVVIL